jgi:mercuric reductase
MPHYELIIIGGGAGGFGAAIKANDLGAKTALINSGLPLGGTCVNVGCVPSKTLLWAAEVLHTARHHQIPGLDLDVTRLDVAAIVRDELALVQRMRDDKYAAVLRALEHVTFIDGAAQFSDAHTIAVNGQLLSADRFVIATGSTATVPAVPGLREVGFLTHIEALQREQRPASLIVIGAGALGLEFSQLYARLGAQVTVLQRGSSIGPRTEPTLAQRLIEVLEAEGVRFAMKADVIAVERSGQQKRVTYRVDGQIQTVEADDILLAAGKAPNTENLGLEHVSVKVDSRHAIIVSPSLQASAPHVYAVGDVAALSARLEMTAGHEGTFAAENALTGSRKAIDYDTVPYTVFTDPQLAGVGLTEDEQMGRLGVCACRTVGFEDVPKARILKRTEGLIKMAIHPETTQIMGIHLLAPHAGDLVAQAMMIVRNRNTIDDLLESLPMFPTLSESIKLVAMSFTRDISKVSCCV